MKTLLLCFLMIISIVGCDQSEVNSDGTCTDYLTNAQRAKNQFRGEWKLTKIYAMIPNPTVPDVKLVIDKTVIKVWEDGRLTDHFGYNIVKTPSKTLQLKTDSHPRANGWYVRNPALRLCQNRLVLDTGMASDSPGYEFQRVR